MKIIAAVLLLLAGCSKSEPIKHWDPRVLYWNSNDIACTKWDNGGTDSTSVDREFEFCRSGSGVMVAFRRSL
jgi:hypothetical protein